MAKIKRPVKKPKPRKAKPEDATLRAELRQLRFAANVMRDALTTISVKAERGEWAQPKTFKAYADGTLERVDGRR